MNEAINLLTVKTSGDKNIDMSIFNLSGQPSSINITGIKNINLGDADNIIVKNTIYKEISLGAGQAKIIGNTAAQDYFSNVDGVYVNGIKFAPESIVIDGVLKTILVAQ